MNLTLGHALACDASALEGLEPIGLEQKFGAKEALPLPLPAVRVRG